MTERKDPEEKAVDLLGDGYQPPAGKSPEESEKPWKPDSHRRIFELGGEDSWDLPIGGGLFDE